MVIVKGFPGWLSRETIEKLRSSLFSAHLSKDKRNSFLTVCP